MSEIELLTTISGQLEQIEFYAACCAVTAALTMGLVIWRLILLSKNQRELF